MPNHTPRDPIRVVTHCIGRLDEDNTMDPPGEYILSQRFVEAFMCGEVTKGGMAEAGWFDIGFIGEDGV